MSKLNTRISLVFLLFLYFLLSQGWVYGQKKYPSKEQPHLTGIARSFVSIASYSRCKKRSEQQILIGSGFIFHKNGYIVTLDKVVRKNDEIIVTFADDSMLPGQLLTFNSPNGLVLIKVQGEDLPAVSLGRSVTMDYSSVLTIIGNSIGIFPSITLASFMGFENNGYLDLDAFIPPGNCGSPVFDEKGLMTAIILGSVYKTNSNKVLNNKIGVALPIELMLHELNEAVKHFNTNRGSIGMTAMPVENTNFIRIIKIVKDGPADNAGLAVGDTIIMYEGKRLKSLTNLSRKVKGNIPGTLISITLKKGSRQISHLIEVGENIYPFYQKYLP